MYLVLYEQWRGFPTYLKWEKKHLDHQNWESLIKSKELDPHFKLIKRQYAAYKKVVV